MQLSEKNEGFSEFAQLKTEQNYLMPRHLDKLHSFVNK